MNKQHVRLIVALFSAVLWACGGSEKPDEPPPLAKGTQSERTHSHGGEKHAHEDGEHGEDKVAGEHEHGTVRHTLGEEKAGAWTVNAQQADDAIAGGETVFYVNLSGAPKPSSIRLWVGDAKASISTRVLAEWIDDTRAHAHVENPNPLTPADQFWVEIDDGKGATAAAAFDLAAGTVLPAQGPHTGFVVALSDSAGFAELKLHDDKGDLELWLVQDAAMSKPLDLPLDTVITVSFADQGKAAELRVRNTEKNEGEDGNPNIRAGKTNYFIFPGATGADPSWLMGNFRSTAAIQFTSEGTTFTTAPFTLVPHTHGPDGHHH